MNNTTLHCFHCSHLFVRPTWPEFIVNGGPWVRMMWGQREVQVQSGRSTISCSRFLVQFCLSRRLGLNDRKCQKVVKVMTLELLLFGVVLACFFIFSKRWSTQNNIFHSCEGRACVYNNLPSLLFKCFIKSIQTLQKHVSDKRTQPKTNVHTNRDNHI